MIYSVLSCWPTYYLVVGVRCEIAEGQVQSPSPGAQCHGRPDNIDTSAGLIDREKILGRILPVRLTSGYRTGFFSSANTGIWSVIITPELPEA